jgi:glycosyltransferase involved in cell wall biosynthesis
VDRLERLIESAELREEFGSVGRKRVEQFSIEAMVSDLDAIYQELLT